MSREPGPWVAPSRVRLVRVPREPSQRWRLTDPYVELVWAARLGPTTVLVARHLGHALASDVAVIELGDVGAFLGRGDDRAAGARHAVRALGRLSAAGLVSWHPATATLRLSGYVAPLPSELLARMPDVVVRVHDRLLAASGPVAADRTVSRPTFAVPSGRSTGPASRADGGGRSTGGLGR